MRVFVVFCFSLKLLYIQLTTQRNRQDLGRWNVNQLSNYGLTVLILRTLVIAQTLYKIF